jgi:hypothetical protein
MKVLAAMLMVLAAMVLTLGNNQAGEKPKYTIKEVMKVAHKGGLMKKVADGKASADEKTELVALYKALSQDKPPKGELDAWKKKTGPLLEAATKAAKGDQAAAATLPKLAACAACHKEFK